MVKTSKRRVGGPRRHRRQNKTRKYLYSESDYNSNDGMLTTVWGPSTWHFLHTMSFNYPVKPTADDKKHYMDFIISLQHVLPCGKCRKNLKKNFAKLPLHLSDMESRHTFSLYMYRLHELVNRMLGKKSGLSYEDVRDRYEHFRSRCPKNVKGAAAVAPPPKENGCTEPFYGEKTKCVLKIVPQDTKCETFQINDGKGSM